MQASITSPSDRLSTLRAMIAARGLDGLIMTTADAFQNEEAPDHDRTVGWLTGFTGSLAHALVFADRAIFLVDGRYGLQAARQVDGNAWQFGHLIKEPVAHWLRATAPGTRIGYDPMCWTVNQLEALHKDAAGVDLVPWPDPFAQIWQDRPAMPQAPLREMPQDQAGRTVASKLAWLQGEMSAANADLWVETRPDNIAWMFNVRGGDVAMNPLPLSFAVFSAVGPAQWFIDPAKLAVAVPEGVAAQPFEAFLPWLEANAAGKSAAFDPAFTPDAVAKALAKTGARMQPSRGLITVAKSLKTKEELAGYRRAHLDDAIAMARFGQWLTHELPVREATNQPLDEWEVAGVLAGFRKMSPRYLEPSFTTIAATGENGALCHYAPAAKGSGQLRAADVFLCDSGGQYLCGTTDVTRTYAFGPVADDIRHVATAVLKGFIALCAARFPTGTMPHQLDALARAPLWALGLDYDHGTGHGVGHNLLVHEHPHRLGKVANPYGLEAGHMLTIEPGYYDEGRWGIRLENQVEVVARGPGFLGFEPLTLVPIDLSLFDLTALTTEECDWIDTYHQRVRAEIAPLLDHPVQDWLITATQPIPPR
ncbi:aminopeptidase P family protein [Phaeovulum sp.]|uniref:aminopeptidase P family protein n=1 Tax=Phaeovulum sp. TaxID=2934796 RepID=UPI0039E239C6